MLYSQVKSKKFQLLVSKNEVADYLDATELERVVFYSWYLGHLLGAHPDHTPFEKVSHPLDNAYHLVMVVEPRQSWLKTFIFGSPIQQTMEDVPTSLLVVRQPRWPLRHILLIVRSEAVHGLLVNWAIHLAQASGAMVTALVVVPVVSPFSGRKEVALAELLSGDGLLERQVRFVSACLSQEGMTTSLRLRQGSPKQQIRTELSAETYDLVIAAAESKDWWLRQVMGETVEPVLKEASCPVLITKPGRT